METTTPRPALLPEATEHGNDEASDARGRGAFGVMLLGFGMLLVGRLLGAG